VITVILVLSVRMCLRNLGIVWGNYLIIKVAGIPLHIGEHLEHFSCNTCQLIYN